MHRFRPALLRFLLLAIWAFAALSCRTTEKAPDEVEPIVSRPSGVVQRVNFPEKYLIFQASRPFPAGETLVLRRDGSEVGRVRVLPYRRKSIQAADILDGVPEIGDVLQRPAHSQTERGH